jgi:hypothetical protein
MGLILWVLGGGAKQAAAAVGQMAWVFKPNAEASETRGHTYDRAALAQCTAKFAHPRRGWFDGLVDGLNRLVRPATTFGLLGILPAVVIWPEGATIAFAALALLPAGYWALVTVIIGFYFCGRMQLKAQNFQKFVQSAADRAPEVIANIKRLRTALSLSEAAENSLELALELALGLPQAENAAVRDWAQGMG